MAPTCSERVCHSRPEQATQAATTHSRTRQRVTASSSNASRVCPIQGPRNRTQARSAAGGAAHPMMMKGWWTMTRPVCTQNVPVWRQARARVK